MLVHIDLKYWVKFVLGWIKKKLYIYIKRTNFDNTKNAHIYIL